ncbi:hypothetical protein CEXT_85761 [Caerostris extrusa]|uniref:Uncharacterized protein n=1 Tax=Caerostris extrusa TaxID=172846 RepID=A0AAV4QYT5_CAEEX|nr:hypothetical protein CEXT_85761 [Caerostris extrusa]
MNSFDLQNAFVIHRKMCRKGQLKGPEEQRNYITIKVERDRRRKKKCSLLQKKTEFGTPHSKTFRFSSKHQSRFNPVSIVISNQFENREIFAWVTIEKTGENMFEEGKDIDGNVFKHYQCFSEKTCDKKNE